MLPEPGETTPWGQIYSVALFHQLHCLGAIRDHYWKLLDAILDDDENLKDLAKTIESSHHINHCYDYIRQSLQCSGDMSLEWPRTEPDGQRFVVDGWNIPHQCKSWVSCIIWQHRGYYCLYFQSGFNHKIHGHVPLQRVAALWYIKVEHHSIRLNHLSYLIFVFSYSDRKPKPSLSAHLKRWNFWEIHIHSKT